MEISISNISSVVDNRKNNVPIFPGYEQIDIIRFPIFPGFQSANLIFGINFAIRFRLEINLVLSPRNSYNYPRSFARTVQDMIQTVTGEILDALALAKG